MGSPYFSTVALAGLLLVLPSLGHAQDTPTTPEDLGEAFCAARISGDMEPIAVLVTITLWSAIADAYDQNETWAAANPNEKPPLGDGVPWASHPDRPDQCAPGEPQWQMDEARLTISYGFNEAADTAFTDTLLLRRTEEAAGDRGWFIDNVVYATGGDMRTALLSAFMN